MKKIIVDLDGTITFDVKRDYSEKEPNIKLINKLANTKKGFEIVIFTARNMNTTKKISKKSKKIHFHN